MAGSAKGKLLSSADIGPTTPGNKKIVKDMAQVDDLAPQVDFLCVIFGSPDLGELGKLLRYPRVASAVRESILQGNTGGYLEANGTHMGRNYFNNIIRTYYFI